MFIQAMVINGAAAALGWRIGSGGRVGSRSRGALIVGGAKRNPRTTGRMIAGMMCVSGGESPCSPNPAWGERGGTEDVSCTSLHS
jgi:hypothetical protein